MKKGMQTRILKKAGFESVKHIPRTVVGFSSKAFEDLSPQFRSPTRSNVEQRVECLCTMRKDSTD